LRADMDALPIQEETGLPFASETADVMHAYVPSNLGFDAPRQEPPISRLLRRATPRQ
jgi:hypothetical protein